MSTFRQLLSFSLKDCLGAHALFMATGDYHHHLAVNTWGGVLPSQTPADLGLAAYTLSLSDLAAIEARLCVAHWPFATTGEQIVTTDPTGHPALRPHRPLTSANRANYYQRPSGGPAGLASRPSPLVGWGLPPLRPVGQSRPAPPAVRGVCGFLWGYEKCTNANQ